MWTVKPIRTLSIRWIVFPLIVFLSQLTLVHAQGVSVDAQVDRTKITIGDRINLDVAITADTTLEIILPAMEQLLGVYEVKDYEHLGPTIDEAGRRVHMGLG